MIGDGLASLITVLQLWECRMLCHTKVEASLHAALTLLYRTPGQRQGTQGRYQFALKCASRKLLDEQAVCVALDKPHLLRMLMIRSLFIELGPT